MHFSFKNLRNSIVTRSALLMSPFLSASSVFKNSSTRSIIFLDIDTGCQRLLLAILINGSVSGISARSCILRNMSLVFCSYLPRPFAFFIIKISYKMQVSVAIIFMQILATLFKSGQYYILLG